MKIFRILQFYTITSTDQDVSDNITYSISGVNSGLITVNSTNGKVRLKTSANYESKSSYSFNVIATDNGIGNLSNLKAVTLNISDSIDAPVEVSIMLIIF